MQLHAAAVVAVLVALAAVAADAKPRKGKGSMWWGIARAGEPNNLSALAPSVMYLNQTVENTLRKKQQRLVRENPGVLAAVAKGANMAILECQHQFRNRHWNCSTTNFLRGKNLFGKIVDRGCRETAFIYAIMSAAVTHAVARACAEGSIESCTCDYSHQARGPPTPSGSALAAGVRDWEWGGCSDNVVFGYRFSKEFVDAGERGRNIRKKMNLHNNEAGRKHVEAEMKRECKCHGMSGSCTVKTCWMRLPSFRTIGDNLKDRFDGASRVRVSNSLRPNDGVGGSNGGGIGGPVAVGGPQSLNSIYTVGHHPNNNNHNGNNRGNGNNNNHHNKAKQQRNRYKFQLKPYQSEHKPPGDKDLVYLELSPGFCFKNSKLGILGTHGRQCNDTSMGVDGCDLLCCGRGYRTRELVVKERCSCTFHWCCEVQCKTCVVKKAIHLCL